MIGIIYKFTIIAKYKMDGNKPFYIGQCTNANFGNYWGSGIIWKNFVNKLKQTNPCNWKYFIKREILFSSDKVTQRGLDALEAYWIKKEKAHYSLGLGGCNILWGTANKFGSGSPMKDPLVAKKCSEKFKKFMKEHPEVILRVRMKRIWKLHNTDYRQRISKTLKGRYIGDKNPNFGNYWTNEQRNNLSKKMKGRYIGRNNPNYGHKWTDEQRKRMSNRLIGVYSGKNNPMYGKKRITNGVINSIIESDAKLPEGFRYGMIRKNKSYEN